MLHSIEAHNALISDTFRPRLPWIVHRRHAHGQRAGTCSQHCEASSFHISRHTPSLHCRTRAFSVLLALQQAIRSRYASTILLPLHGSSMLPAAGHASCLDISSKRRLLQMSVSENVCLSGHQQEANQLTCCAPRFWKWWFRGEAKICVVDVDAETALTLWLG